MGIGKKFLAGFLSTLAWVILSLAIVATSANFIVNGLSHVGDSASTLIKDIASDPKTLNSIINDMEKNSDPDSVKLIEESRSTIDATLASLGGSADFRDSLAATLNQIAQAVLAGDKSVKVDFSHIVEIAASKINAASKKTVIKKKELAKIKPTTLDLSKQSKVVKKVRDYLHLSLLLWVFWLVLLLLGYLLRGKKIVRTFGLQLFSVGALGLLIRFGAPSLVTRLMNNSSLPEYQRELITKAYKLISAPAENIGVVLTIIGVLLFTADFVVRRRRVHTTQSA
jgi:hypothetical protein